MDKKYIEVNALLNSLGNVPYKGAVKRVLIQAKAEDVKPIEYADWVWLENGMDWNIGAWVCSKCGVRNNNFWQSSTINPYEWSGGKYCPNCGAYMTSNKVVDNE